MPSGDQRQQACREAVRAFDLCAAALADPVPKLLTDLTALEEHLSDLEREQALIYFSPFGALPEDIACDRGETVHSSSEATPISESMAGHQTLRSDTGSALAPGGADDLSRATSPGVGSPVFSFRRSDSDVREGSMNEDVSRGHFHDFGTAPEDPGGPVNSAYQELAYDYGNEESASGELLLADPMSLLDGLVEDALGAVKAQTRDVALAPNSNSPNPRAHGGEAAAPVYPQSEHSLVSEGQSVAGLPDSVSERIDTSTAAQLGAASDFHNAGVDPLIYSLVEDLFSPKTLTPDYELEVADQPGEPVAPDRSTFDEPVGAPAGVRIPDDKVPEKISERYLGPEALADLVNEVLVRQARRHGVDLS